MYHCFLAYIRGHPYTNSVCRLRTCISIPYKIASDTLQVNKCRVNMFVELRYMTIYGKKTETHDYCRELKRSMWAGWCNSSPDICPAMSLFNVRRFLVIIICLIVIKCLIDYVLIYLHVPSLCG